MIAMVSPSLASREHTLNTLRYADRVKELGVDKNGGKVNMVQDLSEEDEGDDDEEYEEPQAHEQSGLAQLRILNDAECSADWYNFQESVAQIQVIPSITLLFYKKHTLEDGSQLS